MKKRIHSFGHALAGIRSLIRTQPNARIHLVATVVVCAAGFSFRVSAGEWIALVVAIAIVWSAEALNTAGEFLADEISQEYRERIKQAKDIAAAGVLFAAIGAAIVGAIVFLPRLIG